MYDLFPKNGRKEFIEKFGQELDGLGVNGDDQSYVNYVDGLTQFDDFLGGVKFENTRCGHSIFAHENGLLLIMVGANDEGISINIWKDEIDTVTAYHNQTIKIPKRNAFIRIVKSGAAGLIWSGVGHITDNIIKRVKPVESKDVVGTIYEFWIKPRQGGELKFRLSSQKANKYLASKLFDKYLNTSVTTKDDKRLTCFIATVCYSNPYAHEVVNFRKYRDQILLKSKIGRVLVSIYYFFSPSFADFLYQRPFLKRFIKSTLNIIHKHIESKITDKQS